jgi:hypothetical protein
MNFNQKAHKPSQQSALPVAMYQWHMHENLYQVDKLNRKSRLNSKTTTSTFQGK